MATEIDIMGAIGGSGTIDYIIWTIVALLGAFMLLGLLWLIRYLLSFNIKVEISKQTSGGNIIITDRARETKIDGKIRWEFLKYKTSNKQRAKVQPPDKRYIDILKKGQLYCRFKEFQHNLIPVHPEVKLPDEQTLKESTLSAEDRNAQVADIEDAYNKHKPSSIMAMIEKFMPVITIVILTIMLMIGMSEFQKAQVEITESQKGVVDSMNKGIENMNALTEKLLLFENTGELPIKDTPPE